MATDKKTYFAGMWIVADRPNGICIKEYHDSYLKSVPNGLKFTTFNRLVEKFGYETCSVDGDVIWVTSDNHSDVYVKFSRNFLARSFATKENIQCWIDQRSPNNVICDDYYTLYTEGSNTPIDRKEFDRLIKKCGYKIKKNDDGDKVWVSCLDDDNVGYLYMLEMIDAKTKQSIYKIGRSEQPDRPINKYKWHIVHAIVRVSYHIDAEKELIKKFKEEFKLSGGREWFSGNRKDMMRIFNEVCAIYNCRPASLVEEEDCTDIQPTVIKVSKKNIEEMEEENRNRDIRDWISGHSPIGMSRGKYYTQATEHFGTEHLHEKSFSYLVYNAGYEFYKKRKDGKDYWRKRTT